MKIPIYYITLTVLSESVADLSLSIKFKCQIWPKDFWSTAHGIVRKLYHLFISSVIESSNISFKHNDLDYVIIKKLNHVYLNDQVSVIFVHFSLFFGQ